MQRVLRDEEFQLEMKKARQPLVLVIKAHYYIDVLLTAFLTVALPQASAMELERVSLLLKFDFLSGLGFLPKELRPVFDKINSIRNKFAHNPNYKLTKRDRESAINVLFTLPIKIAPEGLKTEKNVTESLRNLFVIAYVDLMVAVEKAYRSRVEMAVIAKIADDVLKKKKNKNRPNDMPAREYAEWLVNRVLDSQPCLVNGRLTFNPEIPD
jgi:hypothetical protein